MMKKLLLLLTFLGFTLSIYAQVTKSVTLTTAGTLATTLTATELSTVTNLTLGGTIDARDFKTMRDKMPKLAVLDMNQATIAAYTGSEGTVIGSNTFPADAIPQDAFSLSFASGGGGYFPNSNLITVSIPVSVTVIGDSAFRGCKNLSSILIPSSVTTIGMLAFKDCPSLTFILIPSSVTTIGKGAFMYCRGLTAISIPASVTSIDNMAFFDSGTAIFVDANNANFLSLDGVLFNKDKTLLIYSPYTKKGSYTIPESVTKISAYAFYRCIGLTSISIPASVTTIGNYAFYYCDGLPSISIPASVTLIEGSAFVYSDASIVVDANNPNYSSLDGILFNKDKTLLSYYPTRKKGDYTIPSTVTTIDSEAFYACSELTKISIPSSVTTIGAYAFCVCTSMTTISIPGSVTTIGNSAFSSCTGLTSFYVTRSTPVDLSKSTNVFYDVDKTKCTLYVPLGSKSLYAAASQWKDFKQIVEMSATAANEPLMANSFKIFPNPVTGPVTIDLGETVDASALMTIYNTQGALVMQQPLDEQKTVVDLSKLRTGSYAVKVNSRNKTQSKVLIKN